MERQRDALGRYVGEGRGSKDKAKHAKECKKDNKRKDCKKLSPEEHKKHLAALNKAWYEKNPKKAQLYRQTHIEKIRKLNENSN